MVKEELIDSGERIRHWSDKGMKIRQDETGVLYDDAVDIVPCRYTYTETNEPVEPEDEPTIEDKAEAFDILMGVTE